MPPSSKASARNVTPPKPSNNPASVAYFWHLAHSLLLSFSAFYSLSEFPNDYSRERTLVAQFPAVQHFGAPLTLSSQIWRARERESKLRAKLRRGRSVRGAATSLLASLGYDANVSQRSSSRSSSGTALVWSLPACSSVPWLTVNLRAVGGGKLCGKSRKSPEKGIAEFVWGKFALATWEYRVPKRQNSRQAKAPSILRFFFLRFYFEGKVVWCVRECGPRKTENSRKNQSLGVVSKKRKKKSWSAFPASHQHRHRKRVEAG